MYGTGTYYIEVHADGLKYVEFYIVSEDLQLQGLGTNEVSISRSWYCGAGENSK